MRHEDLDRWAVPHDQLPRQLWFVRHGEFQCGSEDEWNSEDECPNDLSMMDGIPAACPKALYECVHEITNVVDIYRKIKRHLDWPNRRPSCFVSTFRVCSDSHDWAVQRGGTVRIYRIDTRQIPFVHVFRPADFNLKWPKDEYLFLHQIPNRAIECFYVMPDDCKAKPSRSAALAPSPPQSMNDLSPHPGPSRKSDKRKREEDVVSSRKTRLRTNTAKAIGPTATSEGGGDGKK